MRYLKYWFFALLPLAVLLAVAVLTQDKLAVLMLQNTWLNIAIALATLAGAVLYARCLWLTRVDTSLLTQMEEAPQELQARLERGDRPALASLSTVLLGHAFKLRQRPGSAFEIGRMREEYEYIRDSLQDRLRLPAYVIGLLVALGLVGMFVGMIETLAGARQMLAGLNDASGSQSLMLGLREVLNSVGSVFSAPLFAVSGAIMLGFMGLAVRACHAALLRQAHALIGDAAPVGMVAMSQFADGRATQLSDADGTTMYPAASRLAGLSQFAGGGDGAGAQPLMEIGQALQQLNQQLHAMQQNQAEWRDALQALSASQQASAKAAQAMQVAQAAQWSQTLQTMQGLQDMQGGPAGLGSPQTLEQLAQRVDEFAQGVGAALRIIFQNQRDGFDRVVQALESLRSDDVGRPRGN